MINENNPVFEDLKKRYGKVVHESVRPNYIIEFIFIGLVVGMLGFYAGLDVAHTQCEETYGVKK